MTGELPAGQSLCMLFAVLLGAACSSSRGSSSATTGQEAGGAAGTVGADAGHTTSGGQAGTSGTGGSARSGEGGDGPLDDRALAGDDIVFSVGRSAQGLPATAVAGQAPNAPSAVYRSNGRGRAHVPGENTYFVGPTELGLLETDNIDGFSLDHGYSRRWVHFSLRDEGAADEGTGPS
jgi:hypothetical protein